MGLLLLFFIFSFLFMMHAELRRYCRYDRYLCELSRAKGDAFVVLFGWLEANPEKYIGDTSYAQELVLNYIAAYECYCEAQQFERDDEHIAELYSWLQEHAPSGPRKSLKPVPEARMTRAFSFAGGICRSRFLW